jgi:hypothetical protein
MLIERVSASIRFSQDTGQGWKTIELGAEAHIEPAEDCALAQQGLYSLLATQLRQLWPQNGTTPEHTQHTQNGAEKAVEPGSWEEVEQAQAPKDTEGTLVRRARNGFPEVREGRTLLVLPQDG